ncbi:MAG: metallophosphoesterase [Phycisphaerae bacterium]|nr:metallophosphoesterase [Phycisphaerae bacterium]
MGFCTSWAIDHKGSGHEWLEVVDISLSVKNLDSRFVGTRIVHISDLHCSRTVTDKYLARCIQRINRLNPDLVLLTGDYITHDVRGIFRQKAIAILAAIHSKYGVYACLGNHDYGIGSVFGSRQDNLLEEFIQDADSIGVKMLQNESFTVEINSKPLHLVGLGDLWLNDTNPEKAFARVKKGQNTIALMHNPEGMPMLRDFPADLVLSGHTHGARNKLSAAPNWKIMNRNYHAGLYEVHDKMLYVNRGLGRLGRTRLNCRPEITVFTLC